ncbi:hypothetical protein DPMN_151855 [Dreissena polymorpha]|uniref:Uncharacterized protein n=1 Tax=Dreissena polymorpha TaxID=45954 RepID=A0A9D4J7D9_DREPO|nr:hypothetical protein DPMN_151855 [Dreissena polymorpha]
MGKFYTTGTSAASTGGTANATLDANMTTTMATSAGVTDEFKIGVAMSLCFFVGVLQVRCLIVVSLLIKKVRKMGTPERALESDRREIFVSSITLSSIDGFSLSLPYVVSMIKQIVMRKNPVSGSMVKSTLQGQSSNNLMRNLNCPAHNVVQHGWIFNQVF